MDTAKKEMINAPASLGRVCVVGGGLAGSEAALTLARHGVAVTLFEMRPVVLTPVHTSSRLAELVCSNSLKSEQPHSAAGMLKHELDTLGSALLQCALDTRVAAGGALAVDRDAFSAAVESLVEREGNIQVVREEVTDIAALTHAFDAVILATGPLSSDALATSLECLTGQGMLAFFDAAAPIVLADSLDTNRLFRQDRYGEKAEGDYLNAPFDKAGYERFMFELVHARRVVAKEFERQELFQACQPIEEIARRGIDAARFGPMKPVGLVDPQTNHRPWAAVQLRAEDREGKAYNLVGFQTNLTFPEQQRVFSLIPGLEHAEFARFGVMHRNTFVDAPSVLDATLALTAPQARFLAAPLYLAGQLSGTEGYCEAIRSGLHAAISVWCQLAEKPTPSLPPETVFGALIAHATDSATVDYQPMHVNFGIIPSLECAPRRKQERYAAYARRGDEALARYVEELSHVGFF